MILLKYMNFAELKRHVIELELQSEDAGRSIFSINSEEVLSYFRTWQNDKFLVLKFKGEKNILVDELSYVKFPKRTFGKFIAYKGDYESTLQDYIDVQSVISEAFMDDEWNPLLGWIGNSNSNQIELEIITKVFNKSDITDKMVFNSLIEVLIHDMDIEKDKSLCESLEKAPRKIVGNDIELNMAGMTRSSFIMSLKKEEFEKNIYEYTDKRLKLRII